MLPEVDFYLLLEIREDRIVYRELPVQVVAHLPLHLVDLPQRKHALRHYTPRLVRVSVVAHDF